MGALWKTDVFNARFRMRQRSSSRGGRKGGNIGHPQKAFKARKDVKGKKEKKDVVGANLNRT